MNEKVKILKNKKNNIIPDRFFKNPNFVFLKKKNRDQNF